MISRSTQRRFLASNIFQNVRLSDSREKRVSYREKRDARNETRLARNETRGGNLHLSGTVDVYYLVYYRSYSKCMLIRNYIRNQSD